MRYKIKICTKDYGVFLHILLSELATSCFHVICLLRKQVDAFIVNSLFDEASKQSVYAAFAFITSTQAICLFLVAQSPAVS